MSQRRKISSVFKFRYVSASGLPRNGFQIRGTDQDEDVKTKLWKVTFV